MDEEIKKLLEQNYQLTKEIYRTTKYIKRYVLWSQVYDVIKIFVIVVPLVIGAIYLMPLLKGALKQYEDLMGMANSGGNTINQLQDNLKLLPSDLNDLLK